MVALVAARDLEVGMEFRRESWRTVPRLIPRECTSEVLAVVVLPEGTQVEHSLGASWFPAEEDEHVHVFREDG